MYLNILPVCYMFKCAMDQKISYGPIYNCAIGTMGNNIYHNYGVQTGALKPPHQYVPWIVVNGV